MSTNDTLRGLLAEARNGLSALENKASAWLPRLVQRIDAALAEPVSGAVVLPERKQAPEYKTFVGGPCYYAKAMDEANGYNQALDDVAALNGGAVAGQKDLK